MNRLFEVGLLTVQCNLYFGGNHPAESWGSAVAQRQLWQEGSCEVGVQAGQRMVQYCTLLVFNSLILCHVCRPHDSSAEQNT